MDEKTITILEKQQAIILGEVGMAKKDYSGHDMLIAQLNMIECSAETTLDYLKAEREKILDK